MASAAVVASSEAPRDLRGDITMSKAVQEATTISDAAWERLIVLVQAVVEDVANKFEAMLLMKSSSHADELNKSVHRLQSDSLGADVRLVCAAGDGDLLEEVVLDLVLEALKRRAIPQFWASIPSARNDGASQLPRGWHRELSHRVILLRQLQAAHTSLLQELLGCRTGSSGAAVQQVGLAEANELVSQYRVSFRVAMQDSWPAKFAEELQLYFRFTWQLRAVHARKSQRSRRRGGQPEEEPEEWWWMPLNGEPPPFGPADRVLALLNPARRPALLAPGGDAVMSRGQGNSQADGVARQPELWLTELGEDSSAWCDGGVAPPDTAEEDSDGEEEEFVGECGTPISMEQAEAVSCSFREVADALQSMGLGDVWCDLVMRFLADELSSTVQERCRSEYDAKGLLHQLTSWLYNPLLRWLRAAHGLELLAPRQIPSRSAREGDDLHRLTISAFEAEERWWGSARRAVLQFFEIFVEVRILEAFDMVRDFPESIPALLDLRRCLARTGRTAPLVRALRQQLSRRLLIAGAHTRDVIKVYIKTIKAMRLVDPRGLLLEAVSAPIRAYLKRRKDTVRCIVTALTEDSELQLELHTGAEAVRLATAGAAALAAGPPAARGAPEVAAAGNAAPGNAAAGNTAAGNAQAAAGAGAAAAAAGAGATAGTAAATGAPPAANAGGTTHRPIDRAVSGIPAEPPDLNFGNMDYEASDDEEDPDSWMPDPIDADPLLPSRQRRAQDVISLLVGIYGSKEMFIKEYKEMLADRLLGTPSSEPYATERETQNLELLKTRFGEAALVHCEVMLQDIKDSRRINANVQQSVKARENEEPGSAVASFRPPPRGGATAGSGNLSRPFMAPFSLSGIFGLCLSPGQGQGQAGTPGSGTPGASVPTSLATPVASTGDSAEVPMPVAESEQDFPLSVDQMQALVLSRHYWPSAFAKEEHQQFRLPEVLESALSDYSRSYTQIRAKRALTWKRTIGLVEITVRLADRDVTVAVTPVHLAVLACFERGDTDTSTAGGSGGAASAGSAGSPSTRMSLQEVASRLELPEALVRKRIGYWVSKGVLREVSAGVFDVQESLSTVEGAGARGSGHLDDDAEHSPGQTSGTGRAGGGPGGRDVACAAELEACKAFVQGMLTQYESLPLGRIHNFLQRYMIDPPLTQTEGQLREFLSRLCQEGKLEFNGSNYSLVKKG